MSALCHREVAPPRWPWPGLQPVTFSGHQPGILRLLLCSSVAPLVGGGPRSRDSGLCRVRTPHSPGSPASLEPLVLSAAPLYPGLSLLRPGPVPSWSPVPGGFSGPCPDRTGGTCPGSVQTYPSWSHGGPRSSARLGVCQERVGSGLVWRLWGCVWLVSRRAWLRPVLALGTLEAWRTLPWAPRVQTPAELS